jgi:putative flippase GtrA
VIVGLVSNLSLLAFFILLLQLRVPATTAAVIIYAIGVAGTYFLNRGWSFSSRRRHSAALWRYVLVHLLGVMTVIALQWVFHYRLGVPATVVQVAAMVLTAGMIFCLLEWVVFPSA